MSAHYRVHALPVAGVRPCCHRGEWDTPLCERETAVEQQVTCDGAQ